MRASQSGSALAPSGPGALGGCKRSRVAASLSSVSSEDMRMLSAATEDLATYADT